MRCKTGMHEWLDAKSAGKCCNGFVRVLVFPGDALWPERDSATCDRDTGTIYGRAWMPAPPPRTVSCSMPVDDGLCVAECSAPATTKRVVSAMDVDGNGIEADVCEACAAKIDWTSRSFPE